jgi:hypothetical protein
MFDIVGISMRSVMVRFDNSRFPSNLLTFGNPDVWFR